MANHRDDRNFAKGYQSAMEDIDRELKNGGIEAVEEWIKNNYLWKKGKEGR